MSHVDEGALHAYLDGALDEYPATDAERIRAHLDACAECAGRLEEERRVRGDAHAILALASPEVELPGLEELKAYVQRTRAVRSPASTRLWRLGWAASVMLALGTGWLVRGQAGPTGRMTAPVPTAEVAEERVTGGARPSSGDVAGVAGLDAAVDAGTRADFADRQVAEPGSAENETAAGAGSTVASAAVPAPAVMAEAAAVPPPEPADRVAETVREFDAEAPSELVALSVAPVVQAGVADAVPTETVVAGSADAATQPDAAAKEREESARARAASPVSVTSALERSAAPARRSVADDEAIDASVPSLVVPGLEVVSVTNLGPGTTASGVHVVQRLGSGALIDIWHLEPDVGRDVLPMRDDGLEEVAQRTENGWIVLRGPVTMDELTRLLDSLLPGGA